MYNSNMGSKLQDKIVGPNSTDCINNEKAAASLRQIYITL